MTPTQPPGALEQRINVIAERIVRFFVTHWLAVITGVCALYVAVAALAPILASAGFRLGADVIYLLYKPICHQLPQRSFFINGHQMACCQRCTAIYGAIFLGGLLFWLLSQRMSVRPLRFTLFLAIFVAPIALDGGTQLIGLRESVWPLRVLTGGVFGLGLVWFGFPHLQKTFRDSLMLLNRASIMRPTSAPPS